MGRKEEDIVITHRGLREGRRGEERRGDATAETRRFHFVINTTRVCSITLSS